VCALSLAGLGAALATVQARGGFDIEFFRDAGPLPRIVQGFSRPSDFEQETGAAVREQAHLRLRRLTRSAPWRAQFLARSSSSTRPSDLIVSVDDTETLRRTLTAAWTSIAIEIPAADRPGLVLGFRPASDGRRTVPVVVGDIALRSTSWARLNRGTATAMLVCALAIGLLVAVAAWEVRALTAGLVALVMLAIVITRGLATEGEYAEWATWWTGATTLFAAASIIAVRRWCAEPRAWTTAIVLSAMATVVHGLVLGHPLMGIGDSLFHLHRFQSVDGGRYFMTSEAPGGDFPYPIAFYVVAKGVMTLLPFVDDTRWMLRALCICAHAGAALAVFGLVLRWRSAAEAFWAQLLFLVVPVGFHTQGVAYLTNSFGQSLSVIAMCLAGVLTFHRRLGLGVALVTVAATVAFLSHLGSFMLLGVSLALFAGLCVSTTAFRRRGTALALSTACAGILSVVLFYAWFGDTYRALMARPPAALVTAPAGPPPVMRREAHQTQFVPGLAALRVRLAAVPRYVDRYFGWSLLPLGVLGAIASRFRPVDVLSLCVIAWISAGGLFFALGHVSSIDVRYYLGTYPAFAILGAASLSSHRPWIVWVGRVLATIGTASGIAYCLEWLGHWP
jgi:hypothetical protein